MGLLAALRFLTAIPLPPASQSTSSQVGRTAAYFPAVGAILGLILVAVDQLLILALPLSIVNAILVVVLVLATGAMHVDGLIDTCDGLGGSGGPEQRRTQMRDSRVGSFGVIGAISLLLLKYVALGGLPASLRVPALLLAPTLGRWSVVWAISMFPYAHAQGLGKTFKDQSAWLAVLLGSVFTLAVAWLILGWSGIVIALIVLVVALALAVFLRRKFAGLTGDNYGAIIEIGEVVALLLIVAAPVWGR